MHKMLEQHKSEKEQQEKKMDAMLKTIADLQAQNGAARVADHIVATTEALIQHGGARDEEPLKEKEFRRQRMCSSWGRFRQSRCCGSEKNG